MITSVCNSLEDAITICVEQSRDGQCRYIFQRPGGLFEVRNDAPFEPGYVILAGACNGSLVEVPPQ